MSAEAAQGAFGPEVLSVQVQDPSVASPGLPFESAYRLIDRRIFRYTDPRRRELVRHIPEKVCVFCERGKDQSARFRNQAHAIPAALGNKWLFSDEECDECGERYGKHCENELGNFLHPLRAALQIPSRDGMPRLKPRSDGIGYVDGNRLGSRLLVRTDAADSSVRMNFEEESKLTLTMKSPAFGPLRVMQSLARTACLLLPPSAKAARQSVSRWIRGEAESDGARFYLLFFPGPFPPVMESSLWMSTGANLEFAAFIYQIRVRNVTLLFPMPSLSPGATWTFAFPPQPISPHHPFEPSITPFEAYDDRKIPANEMSLSIIYEQRNTLPSGHFDLLGQVPATVGSRWIHRDPVPICLSIIGRELTISVSRTYLQGRIPTAWVGKPVLPTDDLEVRISGGELPVEFEMRIRTSGPVSFGVKGWRLSQVSAEHALVGARLIQQILRGGRLQMIELEEPQRVLCDKELPRASEQIADEQLQLLEDVALVAKDFGIDLRYPDDPSEFQSLDVELLAAAIRQGYCEAPGARRYELTLTIDSLRRLCDGSPEEGVSFESWSEPSFVIGGFTLSAGRCRTRMEGVSPVDGAGVLERLAKSTCESENVEVEVECTRALYWFERWSKDFGAVDS